MFKKLSILFSMLTAFSSGAALADLAIISHASYSSGPLNTQSIKKIFLGERHSFPDGIKATPIHHAAGSPDRKQFFSAVLRMAENSHKRHWTRMRSTGRGSSPEEMSTYQEVLRDVAKTPGSISYIDASLVNDQVKVLMTVKSIENI